MARIPKPWWREDRQAWFVTIDGERTNLGADEAEANRKFHELMAKRGQVPPSPASASTCSFTVAELLDKYLAWCQRHREPRTYAWYRDHIQSFINFKPEVARLPADQLRAYHVVEWADSHPNWSPAYYRGAIVAVQRPFNWADEMGYLKPSPLGKIPKPTPQRREQAVTPDTWEAMKAHYKEGDPFREILEFAWDTGCRPQEAKYIEARHVELDRHRVAFPPAEAKGKKRWRFIYLTPRAEEILKQRMAEHPEGVIFRNEDDQPWTAQAMACRFGRLKKHLGEKFCTYAFRHGFTTELLLKGVNSQTVSELLGHRDGRMLANYQHLDQHGDHLRKVLTNRV